MRTGGVECDITRDRIESCGPVSDGIGLNGDSDEHHMGWVSHADIFCDRTYKPFVL